MSLLPITLALLAGFCTAIEHTINGRLSTHIPPSSATLLNLVLGLAIMLIVNVISGNMTQYKNLAGINPVLLTGGFFGAMIIYLTSKTIPIMGTTNTLVLIIAGQLAVGIVSDMFLRGMRMDIIKLLGIALVVAGAYIIVRR